MKNLLKTITMVLATSLIGSAEPPEGKGKGKRGPRPVPKEALEKFDADGDGKLNEDERKAARAAFIAENDTDGDGKLSREERKAAAVKRFDKDGDGELNDEEKAAMKKAMERRRGGADRRGPKGKGEKGPRKNKGE